jgi:hypothetical protein
VVQATEAARATVEVYNISGILVQRLFSGQMQAGQSQRFTLNGQRLPAGVYTVRFTTGSKILTRKIMLAK